MTRQQQLTKLLRAEKFLKSTQAGYTPTGPNWRQGMPLLWEVRLDLGKKPATVSLGADLAQAHGLLKETEKGYEPTAPRWKQAMKFIDGVEQALATPVVPQLGPVLSGDKSLLLYAPTHNTDGLEFTGSAYPAFDSGFGDVGRTIIAPESLVVTKQSSASGADAFYADGVSKIAYWFGHLVQAPPNGRWFHKGETMGKIARIADSQGGPHFHTGLDCRELMGKDLRWGRNGHGPDYTYGSPTIGQQLTRALTV